MRATRLAHANKLLQAKLNAPAPIIMSRPSTSHSDASSQSFTSNDTNVTTDDYDAARVLVDIFSKYPSKSPETPVSSLPPASDYPFAFGTSSGTAESSGSINETTTGTSVGESSRGTKRGSSESLYDTDNEDPVPPAKKIKKNDSGSPPAAKRDAWNDVSRAAYDAGKYLTFHLGSPLMACGPSANAPSCS